MSPEQTNPDQQQPGAIADHFNQIRQIEMEGYELGIKKARNALFAAGALIFIGEMIQMARIGLGFDPWIFIIAIIEAAIFVGLALWTRKKPYTAVATGLVMFILVILLGGLVGYLETEDAAGLLKGLVSGFIVKIIILVALIKALSDAKALQAAQNERF